MIASALENLLLWGIYPLWLLAGAGDYLCHRVTDIEHSSGSHESWYHVLQLLVLLVALAVAMLLEMNAMTFGVMVAMVSAHSVLAHMDVSYTDGRRYISPLEQHIHGFMNVLPLVAVAMFGVLHWDEIGTGFDAPILSLASPLTLPSVLLLASFAVLAGIPILEELMRTRRHRAKPSRRHQAGLATIK
ncbi:MAG TPA: hypothetical protein VGE08_08110 [Steroidobacter sp.]|uniref:hypothetical protein n=1 Tax=Steroidobacter sp. TaxID=1978227 RepID=UPI002EDA6899